MDGMLLPLRGDYGAWLDGMSPCTAGLQAGTMMKKLTKSAVLNTDVIEYVHPATHAAQRLIAHAHSRWR